MNSIALCSLIFICFSSINANHADGGAVKSQNSLNVGLLHRLAKGNIDSLPESLLITMNAEYSAFDASNEAVFKGFPFDELTELTSVTSKSAKEAIKHKSYRRIYSAKLSEEQKQNYFALIDSLKKRKEIYSVEPNFAYELEQEPNDVSYVNGDLWGLNGEHGINAPDAWNYSTGAPRVKVGVIDTGVAAHDDLTSNVVSGWDFYNNNSITSDDTHSHGTHVSGIIGAVGNNNLGVSGVNWNVSIVPLQCANNSNHFETSTVVSAINYATNTWGTDNQIDIINYSVDGYGNNVTIRAAIDNYPGLFVWAAGNDNKDIDERVALNGSFNLSNLISVGSIDQDGDKSSFSNYSSSNANVNIYAPGGSIYSTVLNNSYQYKSGTSMAAPYVTGTAALLLAIHPHLSASELKNMILSNAAAQTITLSGSSIGTTTQSAKRLDTGSSALAASSSHMYTDHYAMHSISKHKAYCSCGEYILKPHAVQEGSTYVLHGHTYGNCIRCGALVNLDTTPVVLGAPSAFASMTTKNGSYVLPNGIYVIAEKDLEAYLAETLEFYSFEEVLR